MQQYIFYVQELLFKICQESLNHRRDTKRMKYFIVYMIIVNAVSFIAYGIDKQKARHHRWRIRENMLMGLALIGGFLGAFLGMRFFRHKTKHLKFTLGVPVCALLWAVGGIFYYFTMK